MRFEPVTLTAHEEALRLGVREFLATELPYGSYQPGLGMSAAHSPEFTRKLAERGWVGMAIPRTYGGHGCSPVERFVVVEELLAAGAPVAAHWSADRQTAPTLLNFGTEEQRKRFLPEIAAGRCFFSLGMSEPDAGSDLAAVKCAAVRTDGGWLLSGTKIWTSWAHKNHFFVVLCRTSPLESDRHVGLSQLIVDLSSPGITISPIPFLDGSHHFNEVVLDEVFVPENMVLGSVGDGWRQVTSELAFERSGPDRYMSTWPLLAAYLHEAPGERTAVAVGDLLARYWTIRQMSLSVARALERKISCNVEAALVKDLGTTFEQEVVAVVQDQFDLDPATGAGASLAFEELLAKAVLIAPAFTIRGGTTEILRTVAARGIRSKR
jgi:hypothetical protein